MNTETIIWNLEQVVKLLKEQNMLLKRVFNSQEAARYLGITLETLYHMTGKKLVPFYKRSNNRLVFHHEELEKYLLSMKVGKEGEGKEGRGKGKGEVKTQEPAPPSGLN